MASLDQVQAGDRINYLKNKLSTVAPGKALYTVLNRQIAELEAQAQPKIRLAITKRDIPIIAKPTKPSNDVIFLGKTYTIGKKGQYKSIVQVAKKLNVNMI